MNFDPQTVQYRFCGNLLCVSERLKIATDSGFDFAQLRGCAMIRDGHASSLSKNSASVVDRNGGNLISITNQNRL